jgi:beta-glucanase (GH16 family)
VIDRLASDEQSQVAQTYGRYTVRFATTGGNRPAVASGHPGGSQPPGYGTAFLLWPANDQWAEGEVDFPELVWGGSPSGSVHEIGRPQVNADTFEVPTTTEKRWTTATLEWTPGLLVFRLDGVEVRRVKTDVPSTPFRWGFQSGGTLGTPAADLSGYLYVDSIRIDAWASAWKLR